MPKLITYSAFMMFWVFYEMSGGAEFAPRERVVVSQAPFAQANRNVTYRAPAAPIARQAKIVPVATQTLEPVVIQASFAPPPSTTTVPDVVEVAVVPVAPDESKVEETAAILRYVAGSRVNMRMGPGTTHAILDTLPEGTVAELLTTNGDGWAQIRLLESGQIGWMAERLLSEG